MTESYSNHILNRLNKIVVDNRYKLICVGDLSVNQYNQPSEKLILHNKKFVHSGGVLTIPVGHGGDSSTKMAHPIVEPFSVIFLVNPSLNTQGTGTIELVNQTSFPSGALLYVVNHTDQPTEGLVVDSGKTGLFLNLGYNSGDSNVTISFQNWKRISHKSF